MTRSRMTPTSRPNRSRCCGQTRSGSGSRSFHSCNRQRRIVAHGEFDAVRRRGPAYWLRCVIASTIALDDAPEGTPVVYLPGVSRDDLRNAGAGTPELAPLAALQHRSQWFAHPNGKDWTIRALLSNPHKGLGLNVDADGKTAAALVVEPEGVDRAAARAPGQSLHRRGLRRRLSRTPTRPGRCSNGLTTPRAPRPRWTAGAWVAFLQHCSSNLGFDPIADGEIEAARRLGEASGPWRNAWQRFRASPGDYARIPDRLRQAQHEFLPPNPGAWPELVRTSRGQAPLCPERPQRRKRGGRPPAGPAAGGRARHAPRLRLGGPRLDTTGTRA